MVIDECSKLPENHDVIQQLTDAIYRLEANAAETEEMAAKREAKRDEEMNKIIQENNYLQETIHRLEAKISATEERAAEIEAKRNEEIKQMNQESNEVVTDLSVAMHRLEAKCAETEIKKNEEVKEVKKENSEIIAELSDKVLRKVADIDLLNAQFARFTEQLGKHHYYSIHLSNS